METATAVAAPGWRPDDARPNESFLFFLLLLSLLVLLLPIGSRWRIPATAAAATGITAVATESLALGDKPSGSTKKTTMWHYWGCCSFSAITLALFSSLLDQLWFVVISWGGNDHSDLASSGIGGSQGHYARAIPLSSTSRIRPVARATTAKTTTTVTTPPPPPPPPWKAATATP